VPCAKSWPLLKPKSLPKSAAPHAAEPTRRRPASQTKKHPAIGPLAPLQTWGGKLFAGLYVLYSGLVLIVAAGIVFAPVVHRLLHSFHVETDARE
jgi:hypothetical protein